MDEKKIDTGGGAYVGGDVNTDGDFVGRDKVVYGDEVQGDKSGGVTIGDVSGDVKDNVIAGGDITDVTQTGTTVFDQRGQQVTYQYNAAGNINFGAVQNQMEVVGELEKLQAEIAKAAEADALDEDIATDAEYKVKKAAQQAKKPDADKKTIVEYLTEAKGMIAGVTAGAAATAGLITALTQAIELVQKFF